MLPTETNPKAILDIFEWAIDHEEKALACMAADKLLSIDERNKTQLANYFENSNRNLLSDYLYLDFFIARIKPNLGKASTILLNRLSLPNRVTTSESIHCITTMNIHANAWKSPSR